MSGDLSDSEVVIPTAVKAATPGTRPIVVVGTHDEIASQVAEIASEYRELVAPGGELSVTLAEVHPNASARTALGAYLDGWTIEAASMLKIKGLERRFVVWPTDCRFTKRSTVPEWIFTILTRSTAVTVIALVPDTPASTKAVLARLDLGSLLFWTPEAETEFRMLSEHLDGVADPLRIPTG